LFALPLIGLALAGEATLEADLAATMFDTGVSILARPGWRQSLWDEDGSVLRTDTHVAPSALIQVTPDYVRAGGQVILAPLAIFDLKIHGSSAWYFGNVNTLVGFENATDSYGPSDRSDQAKVGGRSTRFGAMPVLKAKAGPVVVVAAGEKQWVDLQSEDLNGTYYFEPETQLLLAKKDSVTLGTGILAWSGVVGNDWNVLAGALATWRSAEQSGDSLLRVGPLVKVQKGESPFSTLLLVQPHLQDRVFATSQPFVALQVRYTRPSR